LGRRWMLFGVDMKDIFAPALAKAMESWKNGMMWLKADHGTITTWRSTTAIFSFVLLITVLELEL
jgi:hypothetical protein